MGGSRQRGGSRGVSPVIGVVLLVAIVVVLAATVGTYALGFADEGREPAPQVAITTTYDERTGGDGQTLTVAFRSGDVLDARNVSLVLTGATAVDETTGAETPVELDGDPVDDQAGSRVTAGERVVVDQPTTVESGTGNALGPDQHLDLGDATLRLVWDPVLPDVDHSEVIWRWEAGH